MLIFLFGLTGARYLIGGPVPAWNTTVSIAASVYEDDQLLEDVLNGFDVHGFAARLLFGDECLCDPCELCDHKGIKKDQRYIGKNGYVFPFFYGSLDESIARNTGIDIEIIKKATI